MSREDRKARIRAYKEAVPSAGIYQVRNVGSGRVLLGAAIDPEARLNRHRFQLKMGMHPDRELQADWTALGAEAFELAVVDVLKPKEDPAYDPREDLEALLQVWREDLAASGTAFYGRAR